jgi:hypothetical protein
VIGGRSRRSSSAKRRAAEAASPTSAAPAEPKARLIDGWRCEDFSGQTGHAIGRSAQLGDLQVCVTAGGRTDAAQVPPEDVLRWLTTGELPKGSSQPDTRQIPFSFEAQESQ